MLYKILSWNRKQIDVNLAIPVIVVDSVTFQDMNFMEKQKNITVNFSDVGCSLYSGKHNARFLGDCGNRQALIEICSEWIGYPHSSLTDGFVSLHDGSVTTSDGSVKYDHTLTVYLPITTRRRDKLFDFRKKYNINFDLV